MTHISKDLLQERGHPVWADVDLSAIADNIRAIAERVAPAEVMGVVKGYGYGHGNPESAEAMVAGGATRIGVARVAEAIHLREAGLEAPIHVFTEPPPDAAGTMIDLDLTPTVYTTGFASALSEAAQTRSTTVPVHVKLDTGMHRVGVPPDEVLATFEALRSLPGLEIEGVWSHLAVADSIGHPFTTKQLELFGDLLERIASAGVSLRYRHIANSAAALSLPEARFDLVRCGIASYGLYPGPDFRSLVELHPALALRARINMVKEVPAGDRLSYGLKYRLEKDARVVTIPVGYADGYARGFSGMADVLIKGTRYRVSGTVCMDQFMVDVGDDDIKIGDVATLLGPDGDDAITADELAEILGTINYEIASRIPSRVPRLYEGP